MKLPDLLEAQFDRRLNRFLVSTTLHGRPTLAHLANPGRLEELLTPGRKLWLARRETPGVTEFKVVAADLKGRRVYLESKMANSLFSEAVANRVLPEFRDMRIIKDEPRFGHSRLDFLLGPGRKALVEVKSCTLVKDGVALFPDAPTARGARQASDLARACEHGYEGWMVFIVQTTGVSNFSLNLEKDPLFAEALFAAVQSGVNVGCWMLAEETPPSEIFLGEHVPVRLKGTTHPDSLSSYRPRLLRLGPRRPSR